MSFTIWICFGGAGVQRRVRSNEKLSKNRRIGALDRDRDRSRRPPPPGPAHCHGFGRISGSIFDVNSIKKMKNIRPKTHPKSGHPKTRKRYQNGHQNASKIDAKRHKQSRLIMKTIKKSVFQKCRNLRMHCKNNVI